MIVPRVRIHKIAWNGNDGEVWYTDAGGAAEHLRALLGSFGFRCGTPVARPGGNGALRALPVVKRGCSLLELHHVCRNDPGVEIKNPAARDREQPIRGLPSAQEVRDVQPVSLDARSVFQASADCCRRPASDSGAVPGGDS